MIIVYLRTKISVYYIVWHGPCRWWISRWVLGDRSESKVLGRLSFPLRPCGGVVLCGCFFIFCSLHVCKQGWIMQSNTTPQTTSKMTASCWINTSVAQHQNTGFNCYFNLTILLLLSLLDHGINSVRNFSLFLPSNQVKPSKNFSFIINSVYRS